MSITGEAQRSSAGEIAKPKAGFLQLWASLLFQRMVPAPRPFAALCKVPIVGPVLGESSHLDTWFERF